MPGSDHDVHESNWGLSFVPWVVVSGATGTPALTFILAAARTAVDAMDSTLDMEDSVLRLSDAAAASPRACPREAAVLITRGRVPNEDTCGAPHDVRLSLPCGFPRWEQECLKKPSWHVT